MSDEPQLHSQEDQFNDSPAGLQRRWSLEIQAARTALEDWHEDGKTAIKEFRGEGARSRVNLFHADVSTKAATLSGIPQVKARRRHADALDDVARVSATALERLLNTDIERDSDGYRRALQTAKHDWLCAGLGQIRLRYVVETEPISAQDPVTGEAIQGERKAFEDVETDHVRWDRFLYSPAETWEDVRWVGFVLELSRAECIKQFGEHLGGMVKLRTQRKEEQAKSGVTEVFGRAEVVEIWDRETKRVLFWSEGMPEILKVTDDKLGLPGFFPSPRPLMLNIATGECVPRTSYAIAKAQYDEANELARRIRGLVKQVKVAGAYDAMNEGLQRLLEDSADGKLIPVKNWSSLVAKGGLQGSLAFLPIAESVQAIVALSERLALVKREIYEITGQSDIMRGQAAERATATEQRIKARFGSTRIQADQDEFARFASEAQRIRAFIIAKQFDPQTIVERANLAMTGPDAKVIPQAIELLKGRITDYRVSVDADSLALTDFDSIQQERIGVVQALGGLLTASMPLIETGGPKAMEFVLEVGAWLLAGSRGADTIEGTFDRFKEEAKQAAAQAAMAPPQPPPPDPRLEAEKAKTQATVVKAQGDIAKTRMDVKAKGAEHAMKMRELAAQGAADRANFGMRMAERQMEAESAADVEPFGGA